MLGKTEGKRRRRRQRTRWLDSIPDSIDMKLKLPQTPGEWRFLLGARLETQVSQTRSQCCVLGSGPETGQVLFAVNYVIFLLRVLVSWVVNEGEGSLIGDT